MSLSKSRFAMALTAVCFLGVAFLLGRATAPARDHAATVDRPKAGVTVVWPADGARNWCHAANERYADELCLSSRASAHWRQG
jgi:hypothetical protein